VTLSLPTDDGSSLLHRVQCALELYLFPFKSLSDDYTRLSLLFSAYIILPYFWNGQLAFQSPLAAAAAAYTVGTAAAGRRNILLRCGCVY